MQRFCQRLVGRTGRDVVESMARASKRQVDLGEADCLLGEDARVKPAAGKAPAHSVQPAPEGSWWEKPRCLLSNGKSRGYSAILSIGWIASVDPFTLATFFSSE